jgi:TonB family protein
MEILVGEDGSVRDARIIEGLPDGLDEAALRAAYRMRFRPAKKNGLPVEAWVKFNIVFSLK